MTDLAGNQALVKQFNAYIEQNGLRKTTERSIVLNKALAFNKHFSVDDLMGAIKVEYPLSLATVYNTLELLVKAKILKKLVFDNMPALYERVNSGTNIHLICTECNKIKDVKDQNFIRFMTTSKFPAFKQSSYSLYVYGICNACARKRRKNKA